MNQKDYKTWDKSTKEKFLKIAKEHQDADRFIQGSWLEDEMIGDMHKGCFYGCMTQTENNTLEKAIEVMKLPAWIIYISEKIFEGLPKEEAVLFPLQLLEVIPTNTDTWDLYRERHRIILCDPKHGVINFSKDSKIKKIIQQCHDIWLEEVINTESAESAWSVAESARSVARSAWSAESARSAAWSARSARSVAESARSAESAWSAESAESAAWSARSARSVAESARSAESAESAAESARSATESARSVARPAHYQWMRDTLISLMNK